MRAGRPRSKNNNRKERIERKEKTSARVRIPLSRLRERGGGEGEGRDLSRPVCSHAKARSREDKKTLPPRAGEGEDGGMRAGRPRSKNNNRKERIECKEKHHLTRRHEKAFSSSREMMFF